MLRLIIGDIPSRDLVRAFAAARADHPHAHVLRAHIETAEDGLGPIGWDLAARAATKAGKGLDLLDPLQAHARAWPGPQGCNKPTAPGFAAVALADPKRALQSHSTFAACCENELAALTYVPFVAIGALALALGRARVATVRLLPPHRTAELMGFEVDAAGAILPGRRALVRLLREVLGLVSSVRVRRCAAALRYWQSTATTGLSRLELLRRAAEPRVVYPGRSMTFGEPLRAAGDWGAL
jgi:hypothetical protein